MSQEIPQQRVETDESIGNPPFCRSAIAAVARSRGTTSSERSLKISQLETAFAAGVLTLENLSITTDLI